VITGTPMEVTQKSDVIITSLPSPEALREVFLGAKGIVSAQKKGITVIVTDTVSPGTVRELAAIAGEHEIEVIDAPVSGGPRKAQDGTLTIMVGGKREVYEDCLKILRILGKAIFYVGSIGSGNVVKLINNLLSLSSVVALCEGVILGAKAGVDIRTLREVIMNSTGRSFALEWKLPNTIAKGKFEDGFAIDLACKDLNLIVNFGRNYQIPMKVAETTRRVYEEAKAKGLGRKDHTAIITLLEELVGIQVRY